MPVQNLPGLVLDRAHPLSRGLAAWWPMNEGAGERVNDISGNANAGTLTGVSPSATSGWAGGPQGRAVNFDATNDYITIPHKPSLAMVGDLTMTMWINADYSTNYLMLFVKTATSVPAPYLAYIQAGTGLIELWRGNGVSQANLVSTNAAPLKKWCFIALTQQGTAAAQYLNGRPNGSGTISVATSDAGSALLFGQRAGSYWMNGGLANMRLYNRALGVSEIAQLYADPLAGALSPSRAARYYTVAVADPPAAATAPLSSDRLYNRSRARIWRRGETG